MTAHLQRSALFAHPATAGRRIYRAMQRREELVYVPWFWRWIMWAVRLAPESIVKRLHS
jgi:short-subunit dehydrogenase